jgi:hypothetical protein
MGEKLQPGVRGTDYPTTPLLLEKKAIRKHNVLVGDDPVQVRFAEQFLSAHYHAAIACEFVEALNDHRLLGQEAPQLFRVDRSSLIDISPSVREKTGIWSLDMIEDGSAGANAIVRFAASCMGLPKPSREAVAYAAKEITGRLNDINAAVWHAAWLLLAPVPEKRIWPNPWESSVGWLPRGEDPRLRLNTLYWTLVEYVFASQNDEKGFRKTGRAFRPRSFKFLSALVLPKDRVYTTVEALSAWREHRGDPYACALRVAKIWDRQ